MDDYTEVEIVRFYNACAKKDCDTLKTLALAGRVSQADKKSWTRFIRDLETSVQPVDKPPKADLTSDIGLGDFFNQVFVLTQPGEIQKAADKAKKLNKPIPRTLADVNLNKPIPSSKPRV